ncbi:MAG: hypothetical protein IKY10_00135 [Clostridia bacterium]|nr:hypothetical protein [Clostridia bacterium]
MIKNFEDVVRIKLIDCPMYNEYSVVILLKNGNTIIKDLDSSEEAEGLYNTLISQLKEYEAKKSECLGL